jgi:hypothetical protein
MGYTPGQLTFCASVPLGLGEYLVVVRPITTDRDRPDYFGSRSNRDRLAIRHDQPDHCSADRDRQAIEQCSGGSRSDSQRSTTISPTSVIRNN